MPGPGPDKATWADVIACLGREKLTVRQTARELGIPLHTARYYRKRARNRGFLTHPGGGAYDITGEGEAFVSRWGNRNSAQAAPANSAQPTVGEPCPTHREDFALREIHNSRFVLPILRPPKRLPSPDRSRSLGGRTPIRTWDLRPPHPQNPEHLTEATLEAWGKVPGTARFYLAAFKVLGTWEKALLVQEDLARAAIREAKERVGLALPRTPGADAWIEDPLARASAQPLPSGHGRNAAPELAGQIGSLKQISPTSILDNSPGPGHESGDLGDLTLVNRFLGDLREGRVPEDWLSMQEGYASLRKALIILARRLDAREDGEP